MNDYEGEGMTRKSFWLTAAGSAAILAGSAAAAIFAGADEDRVRDSYRVIEKAPAPPAEKPIEKYVVSK